MKIILCLPQGHLPNGIGSYSHHNIRAPLIALGHTIIDFDCWEEERLHGRKGMCARLRALVVSEQPDLLLNLLLELDNGIVDWIRKETATTTMVMFSDDDWLRHMSLACIEHYDIAVTTVPEAQEEYRQRGYTHTVKSQWGCNPAIYHPVDVPKRYDVTFVGQPYPGRPELICFLRDNGIDVRVWGQPIQGVGWERFPQLQSVAGGYLPQDETVELFSSSKIVLGFAFCSHDGKTPQIKGRTFEYPACRAFQITSWDPRLTEYFREGEEVVFYKSPQDLLEKIHYYLAHDEERDRIAEAAYRRSVTEHTWERRYADIFEQANKILPAGKKQLKLHGDDAPATSPQPVTIESGKASSSRKLLITGGAGFAGSSLAIWFRKNWNCEVVCLDNLKRRGSELTLPRLRQHGISFIHGDVRSREDIMALPPADLMIECSAEPSVLAGYGGNSPAYLIDTNLTGAINCFEWARCHKAGVVFISTSRVYPFDRLKDATFSAGETRLEFSNSPWPGVSAEGVSEEFTLAGIRSLYGATKLSAELMLAEYGAAYDIPFVIDRCGVLAGPWQFGKTDQGVFTHWLLSHHLGRPLSYIGYGGEGKQVRDLLHVEDLAELLAKQIENNGLDGRTWNVGGGRAVSLSLRETTTLCREITGKEVPIKSVMEERPADIPWYVTDARKVRSAFGWEPQRDPRRLLEETYAWIKENERQLIEALG